jgi:hypothetical protein
MKQTNNQMYITNNLDEKGNVLTYSVWDNFSFKELGEFNSLKEARDFARSGSL